MLITHNYFVAAFGPLCAKETILHSADIFFDFVTLFRLLFGYYSSLISSMRRVYRGNLIKSKSSKGTQEHSHNFFSIFKNFKFLGKNGKKRCLFSTLSPPRPNPFGMRGDYLLTGAPWTIAPVEIIQTSPNSIV